MLRLKRIISCIIFLTSIMMFTSVASQAETSPIDTSVESQDEPSHWAEQEISEAIDMSLVPEQLQSNYQNNIKRSQYVLLALKVFDTTGKSVDIIENQPFTDVLGHEYEQEIVKAYNAGIVKGDGKGNFHPDDFITRQEIASLVFNLLMQIAPDKDFTVKNKYDYTDGSEISDWAKFYIDFCFENKILAGYGNNVIDPMGNATIEQSIALLYRLAKNEGLLENTYGPIKFEDIGIETINNFTSEYNTETFNIIKNIADNENIKISSFWDKSVTLSFEYNTISLNSPDFEKNLFALVHDINEELFISTYKELMIYNFKEGEKGLLLFEEYIENMKEKELIDVFEEISETEVFVIETMQDNNNVSYLMGFIQRKQ